MDKIEQALLLAADLRPYYARAISALTPVPSTSTPTIGVDTSWRLYYSAVWVDAVPLHQLAGVIAGHEVEHLLRDHAGRRHERAHSAWNIAGDLEINDDCELQLPPGGLYPKTLGFPDSLLAEEYFERLPQLNETPCCGSGAGSPLPGELEPTGLGLDRASSSALIESVRADVIAHEANSPGSVPAGVLVWANEKPKPVRLPWPRLLAAAIRGEIAAGGRSDYSWSRPARRDSSVLRPASIAIRPRVALIVDTSGSMSDVGGKVLGTVSDILKKSRCEVVAMVECDAAAKMRRKADRSWRGGGGTDLRDGFRLLENIARSATVVVTDCESPWPDIAVPHTVVISTSQLNGPPWAKTVNI